MLIAPIDFGEHMIEARRTQILLGAAQVFAEVGFYKATTKAIAEAAGVSESTILNDFDSKHELLLALMELIISVWRKFFASNIGFAPDSIGKLLAKVSDSNLVPDDQVKVQPLAKHTSAKSQLVEPLTERELEVLQLIAAGLSNRKIADKLFLAPGTVKLHAHNIYSKLAVNGRLQAVAKAQTLGILPPAQFITLSTNLQTFVNMPPCINVTFVINLGDKCHLTMANNTV